MMNLLFQSIQEPDYIETLSTARRQEWFRNHRIVAYSLTAVPDGVLELWSHDMLDVLEHSPAARPYLVFHDFSKRGVGTACLMKVQPAIVNVGNTVDGWEHIKTILEDHSDFRTYAAIVFSWRHSRLPDAIIANARPTIHTDPRSIYRVFWDRGQGFSWLEEQIPYNLD